MLKKTITISLITIIVLSVFGCKNDVLPKPAGQLRLDYPIPDYVRFENNCPFTFDLNSQATLWTFNGDGQLRTAPIVVNSYVIEGSWSGELYVIDALSGTVRWSDNVGDNIPAPDESGNVDIMAGLGAGDGLVVVPTVSSLVAYRPQ